MREGSSYGNAEDKEEQVVVVGFEHLAERSKDKVKGSFHVAILGEKSLFVRRVERQGGLVATVCFSVAAKNSQRHQRLLCESVVDQQRSLPPRTFHCAVRVTRRQFRVQRGECPTVVKHGMIPSTINSTGQKVGGVDISLIWQGGKIFFSSIFTYLQIGDGKLLFLLRRQVMKLYSLRRCFTLCNHVSFSLLLVRWRSELLDTPRTRRYQKFPLSSLYQLTQVET